MGIFIAKIIVSTLLVSAMAKGANEIGKKRTENTSLPNYVIMCLFVAFIIFLMFV